MRKSDSFTGYMNWDITSTIQEYHDIQVENPYSNNKINQNESDLSKILTK